MQCITVSKLKPGMKILKNVFSPSGTFLLAEGTVLNQKHIRKLSFFQIESAYVDDDLYKIYIDKNEKIYDDSFTAVKKIMSQVVSNEKIDENLVTESVTCIVDHILEDSNAFLHLTGIRDKDNYTFLHSVDVCVFSVITGKSLNLNREELLSLGIAALLHDIGKCNIPDDILLKPGKLTEEEFEIIQSHSLYGYRAINEKTNLGELTATIVLQHHEKWDGTGYPFGLTAADIHAYARIITIADIYDALTADRVYRKKVLPHEAAEYIVGHSGKTLDPNITMVFTSNISIYPIGSKVLLNTGEIGEVIDVDKSIPYRPKIKVFSHSDETINIDPYILDLLKANSVFISGVL